MGPPDKPMRQPRRSMNIAPGGAAASGQLTSVGNSICLRLRKGCHPGNRSRLHRSLNLCGADAMAAVPPSSLQRPLTARSARPLQPSQAANTSDRVMASTPADTTADMSGMTPSSKLKRLSLAVPSTPALTTTPKIKQRSRYGEPQAGRDISEARSPEAGLAPAFVLGEPGPSRHAEFGPGSTSGSFTPRPSAQLRSGLSDGEDKEQVADDVLATSRNLRSPIGSIRRKGCRSSILYSPAPRDFVSAKKGSDAGTTLRDAERPAPATAGQEDGTRESAETRSVLPCKEEEALVAKRRKAMTLTDRHADLLTAIALKERRVNELKLELAAQEAALAQLKSTWTSVVSRSTRRPHTTQMPPSSSQPAPKVQEDPRSLQSSRGSVSSTSPSDTAASLPNLLSPSSSTSSRLSLDPVREDLYGEGASEPGDRSSGDNASWTSMLSQAIGPEGMLLNQQALTEGKRFWGKFVETVSAAAGGTVPLDPGIPKAEAGPVAAESSQAVPKLDLTSLRGMMSIPSWSSLAGEKPTAAPAPPKPSNSARLARTRNPQAADIPSAPRPETSELASIIASPAEQARDRSAPVPVDERQPSSLFRDLLDGMSDSGEQPMPAKTMTPVKVEPQRADSSQNMSKAMHSRDKDDADDESIDDEGWGW